MFDRFVMLYKTRPMAFKLAIGAGVVAMWLFDGLIVVAAIVLGAVIGSRIDSKQS